MMSPTTTEVVLVLGSNEDAAVQLERARAALVQRFGRLLAASPVLASPASDRASAPPYLNQAVVVRASVDALSLKQELRAIEASLGRVRPAPRPGWCAIDIDLLGRWRGTAGDIEIWDAKAAAAPYVAPLLAALAAHRTAASP